MKYEKKPVNKFEHVIVLTDEEFAVLKDLLIEWAGGPDGMVKGPKWQLIEPLLRD